MTWHCRQMGEDKIGMAVDTFDAIDRIHTLGIGCVFVQEHCKTIRYQGGLVDLLDNIDNNR